MQSLQNFYNDRVSLVGNTEFLSQVCHSENGRPISQYQLNRMVLQLADLLELEKKDSLLDLACGNGVVTVLLAERARAVTALDFSGRLIEVARRYNGRDNVEYIAANVWDLVNCEILGDRKFSKIVMQAGLQHFNPEDFETLLRLVGGRLEADGVIVFGFIPENGRQQFLFGTTKRRLYRIYLRATRRDIFGTWWSRRQLSNTCRRLGLACSFHAIDDSLAASAYRFNLRIQAQTEDGATRSRETDSGRR